MSNLFPTIQVAKEMRDQFFKDFRQLEHEIRKEQVGGSPPR